MQKRRLKRLSTVGGVLAAIHKDFFSRLAPVLGGEAVNMIEEVKGFATISGYRGMPHGTRPNRECGIGACLH